MESCGDGVGGGENRESEARQSRKRAGRGRDQDWQGSCRERLAPREGRRGDKKKRAKDAPRVPEALLVGDGRGHG